MSLYETGHSTGTVSLAELLNGVTVATSDPGLTIENLGDCVIAGGWPANLGRRIDQATHYVRSYLDEIRRVDVQQVDGVKRDVGRWVALEIKLGGDKATEDAAANLLRFGERIDTTRSGKPASLAIITATGYGYVRKDGITVLPIGALGP